MSVQFVESVGSWWLTILGHFLWQGTVIWMIVAGARWVLRQASASTRYAVCGLALCVMAACLPMTMIIVPFRGAADGPDPAEVKTQSDHSPQTHDAAIAVAPAAIVDRQQGREKVAAALPFEETRRELQSPVDAETIGSIRESIVVVNADSVTETEAGGVSSDSSVVSDSSTAERRANPWLVGTLAAYCAGSLLLLIRMLMGLAGGIGLRRRSVALTDAAISQIVRDRAEALRLRWVPTLAWCEEVAVPTVVGLFRPVILLPISISAGLTTDQLSAVLAHELAHIRRLDHIVNLLQRLLEAVLFFHPAVWCVSRWMRQERENCCDDLVVSLGASRLSYADTLLRVAEFGAARGPAGASAVTALFATGQPSQLGQRISRLLEGPVQPGLRVSLPSVMAFLTLSCVLLLSPIWLALNADEDKVPVDSPAASEAVDADDSGEPDDGLTTADSPDPVIETDGPQIYFWVMFVKPELAGRLEKAARKTLPDQGAFRPMQFESARLRSLLFDPQAASDVVADITQVYPLRRGDASSQNSLHASLSLSQRFSGHGFAFGRYTFCPDEPFQLTIDRVNFDYEKLHGHDERYRIEEQKLEFEGDLPIGDALVFAAEATPRDDLRSEVLSTVLVFETLPRISGPQAERLAANISWFKKTHAQRLAVLRKAARFNRDAAPFPAEIPKKWTRELPAGASLTLVGVARPESHPFCWWDADGIPRSCEFEIQRHAFGNQDVLLLLSLKDFYNTYEKLGIAYSMGKTHPPLRLNWPWRNEQDSEIYIATPQLSAGREAQVTLFTGTGPWKELGRIKPGVESLLGKGDYLLAPPRAAGSSIHAYLARRWLPDIDVRLKFLNAEGDVLPARAADTFRSQMTDTDTIPDDWSGHELYTLDAPLESVAEYILESRTRHSASFSGFATQIDSEHSGYPVPLTTPRALSGQPDTSDSFTAEIVGTRFAATLEEFLREHHPYFTESERSAIVVDYQNFVSRFVDDETPQSLLLALVQSRHRVTLGLSRDYLSFFSSYRSLKWRTWMALRRVRLSAEDRERRESQRQELRNFIQGLPTDTSAAPRTHGNAIARLEMLFDDPWLAWFREPMTDAEWVRMNERMNRYTFSAPWQAPSSLATTVQSAKYSQYENDDRFGTLPLTIDMDLAKEADSPLFRQIQRYANARLFTGLGDLVYHEPDRNERRVLDMYKNLVQVPRTVEDTLDGLKQWCEDQGKGIIAYEAKDHRIVSLRGSRMAILPVSLWQDADRLTDEELRRFIEEGSVTSILLEDHFGERPASSGYGARRPGSPLIAVEARSGELAVVDVGAVSKNGTSANLRIRLGSAK